MQTYFKERSFIIVYSFRAFYLQFSSKLHEVSSDKQGIVSLCALFEQLVKYPYLTYNVNEQKNYLYKLFNSE